MVDTHTQRQVQHPSRKTLRREEEKLITSRVSLTETPAHHEHVARHTGSVRVPAIRHVPHVAIKTCDGAEEETKRNPLIRATAGASICALLLALSLPITENARYAAADAASQQRLFSSEVMPPDASEDSFSEVSAIETIDSSPTSYTFRPEALVNYPFAQPVMLTDPFGYRTAPVEQFHDAQDFAAAAGTPIQAIADGEALEAGFADDGCGFGLKLEHNIDGKTLTSRYCHMQMGSHSFKVGDEVKMGESVGRVGNTGMSFGPHLHLALVLDKKPIDPIPFLSKYNRVDRPQAQPSTN
jgi:murein DD-endopeptidase MepM/ murein hydrolase activator NlpD